MLQDPFLLELSNVAHVVCSTFVIFCDFRRPSCCWRSPLGFAGGSSKRCYMIPVWGRPLFKVIIDWGVQVAKVRRHRKSHLLDVTTKWHYDFEHRNLSQRASMFQHSATGKMMKNVDASRCFKQGTHRLGQWGHAMRVTEFRWSSRFRTPLNAQMTSDSQADWSNLGWKWMVNRLLMAQYNLLLAIHFQTYY